MHRVGVRTCTVCLHVRGGQYVHMQSKVRNPLDLELEAAVKSTMGDPMGTKLRFSVGTTGAVV